MTNPAIASNAMSNAAEIDALDAVLADFNLEDDGDAGDEVIGDFQLTAEDEAEIIEEQAASTTQPALEDEDLAELDLALTRNELYEGQESAQIATTELPAPTAAKAPKKRAETGSTGTKVARIPRDMNLVAPEIFVLSGDVSTMSDEDKEKAKVATMAMKPAQLKIAEKFENLFTALSVSKAPSTYVTIAFDLLEKKKSMTSADIVGAYKASGLGEGTARSQSGQIMHLFATVGIASRSGQTLTLRSDSIVAERLRSLLAIPIAPLS